MAGLNRLHYFLQNVAACTCIQRYRLQYIYRAVIDRHFDHLSLTKYWIFMLRGSFLTSLRFDSAEILIALVLVLHTEMTTHPLWKTAVVVRNTFRFE